MIVNLLIAILACYFGGLLLAITLNYFKNYERINHNIFDAFFRCWLSITVLFQKNKKIDSSNMDAEAEIIDLDDNPLHSKEPYMKQDMTKKTNH